MRNAVRYGNAMKAAMEMDGRRPSGLRTSLSGHPTFDEPVGLEIYSDPQDFLDALREKFGIVGRVAESYLAEGIHTVHVFGTGEIITLESGRKYIIMNSEK